MSNLYYHIIVRYICNLNKYSNIYLSITIKCVIKILLDQSVMMNKFKAWHIYLIEKVQKITGLSNYQIIWISFIEGLTIGFIIGYFV